MKKEKSWGYKDETEEGENIAALNLKGTMRIGWPPIVNEQLKFYLGTMQKVTCLEMNQQTPVSDWSANYTN